MTNLSRRPDDEQRYPEAQEADERTKCNQQICIVAPGPRDARSQLSVTQSAERRQNARNGPYQQRCTDRSIPERENVERKR